MRGIISLVIAISLVLPKLPEGLERVRCTCYLPTGNRTASGCYPYEGIVAASKDRLGQVAVLYTEDMELIGFFECRDTGGHKGLKNGSRIDVYRDSEESMREWIATYGDYVIVQWVECDG